MHQPDPELPPFLSGHGVKGGAPPFERACAGAQKGTYGAGDVVWSRNVMRLDLAVVFEPEVPFATATQMMPVAMVAVGDCLGTLLPPQVGVMFGWPNIVLVNDARAGDLRAAVGGDPAPDEVPRWMAIGLRLALRRDTRQPEPGESPDVTWLSEEGGEELTRTQVIESWCRHLLTWIHNWQQDGFRAVHDAWLYRAVGRKGDVACELPSGERVSGAFVGLDEGGNLLVREGNGATRLLALADWFERRP